MAINDHPDVRCTAPHHREPELPPAVGFWRDLSSIASVWRPRCPECLDGLYDDPVYVHQVAYLDPTRQRRPTTPDAVLDDLHRHGYAIVDRSDPDGTPDPLPC